MKVYKINPVTREITPERRDAALGVYFDNNTDGAFFKMQGDIVRELIDYDARINFLNFGEESVEIQPITDVRIDEDILTCSWILDRRATNNVGQILFSLCFMKSDGSEWNTTVFKDKILEGLEPTLTPEEEQKFETYYEMLLRQFTEAADAKKQEVLDSIPEDYTDLVDELHETKSSLYESMGQISDVEIIKSKNEYDFNDVIQNRALNSSGGEYARDGFVLSKYISIDSSIATYTFLHTYTDGRILNPQIDRIVFYDENKDIILPTINMTISGTVQYLVLPSNAKYLRFSANKDRSTWMFGDFAIIPTEYIPYVESREIRTIKPEAIKEVPVIAVPNTLPLLTNNLYGKKVAFVGTSYTFGQYSDIAYNVVASKMLGFELVNMAVPGNCVHLNSADTIMKFGSLCATKEEYQTFNVVGGTRINIPSAPVPYPTEEGATKTYNNYFRTFENVFTEENKDIEFWVFALNGNTTNFGTEDWDNFNRNTWAYKDGTSFEEHRTTFLGAILYLMDKMYAYNPNIRFCFAIDGPGSLYNVRTQLQMIKDNMGIPFVDLYGNVNYCKPSLNVINSEGGTNSHPSTFAHKKMGKMMAFELMKLS